MFPFRAPRIGIALSPLPLLAALLLLGPASNAAAATIVREFDFSPADLQVSRAVDGARLSFRGGVPSSDPGAPEIPLVPAYVDLAPGETVVSVRVDAETWLPVASVGGRIRPAAAPSPGLPRVSGDPDPALYAADGWYPLSAGRGGGVGNLRGRRLAAVELRPVRVRPASGEVEIATRLVVTLETAPDPSADMPVRRRIVPAWEKEFHPELNFGRGLDGSAATVDPAAGAPGARIEAASSGRFTPTAVPSVEGSPVKFLIITNNAMAGELQRLADWRTQTGVPTVVRTIETIQSDLPYGVDLQDRIRRYIKDAWLQWGVTHVLLAGDTDVIPARYARTTFFGGAFIPTDLYYSDLDGNWNADGDSLFGEAYIDPTNTGDNIDLYPDVYVGRAPIVNVDEAQTFVDKVLQYSRTPLSDYENRAIFLAEVLFPQDWNPSLTISLDGAQDAESAAHRLPAGAEILRMYENYVPYDTVNAKPLTRQATIDSLQRGWGLMHHVGHGFRNTMSVGDAALTNPDAEALNNGDRTWLLYSINCTSLAIDFASIGEAFVLNPHGGAVANVGSTREDFPVTGRSYQDEFYDLVYGDMVPTLGEAAGMQKVPFIGLAFYDNTHRWTQFTLTLLGDPEMQVWWRKPVPLTVGYTATVPMSDTTFTVNVQSSAVPVQGATVCLLKGGEEYEVETTDASGNATLRVRPETAGAATLTVTAAGAHPYEGTVTFGAATGAVLVSRAADRVVDDDNTGGTMGSGDGIAEAGETIDWLLPVTNTGSANASPGVTGTLSTTDPRATVITPGASYGTINSGATASGTPYRVQLAETTPDGTEILFRLDLVSGTLHWVDEFRLPVKGPKLVHTANTVVDDGSNGTVGNGNGRLDVGETVDMTVTLRNIATGPARNVVATLVTGTPGVNVLNGLASFGTVPGATTATSTAFRIQNVSAVSPTFTLTVSDAYGVRFTQTIDVVVPSGVSNVVGTGAASSITLVWGKSTSADLLGYNIYRSTSPAGPFTRVNLVPTDRSAIFVDENLAALTAFYYKVAAVDSSGNVSSLSTVASASTNPPLHPGFPLPTERNMPSSPVIANLDNSNDSSYEMVVGSNVLYAWHADGTPVRDADGTERTSGDFTTEGSYYAAGATIADLDGDGTWEIIAPDWDGKQLHVFEPDGSDYPGFPVSLGSSIWSTAAVGNIDADPELEIVFGSRDNKFFAFNYDGTEVLDGDSNPATLGVFKVLGQPYNDGSPALADLDHDGKLDIIYASFDGFLYAWRWDGSNLPGFPINLFTASTSSPSVGDIDNDGKLEIVVTGGANKLYCYKEDGTTQPGFPVSGVSMSGVSKMPTPALADMEGTGQKDIVINTTDGYVRVYRPNGTLLPAWTNVRYSYTSHASESSCIAVDIDGDGQNEVLVGGEDANLYAFDNDGTLMAGFPIHLNGEVRGTPLVWDLDHDGLSEILVSCWDKNVYLWEYPGAFSPTMTPAWAMWRHDQFRQGRLGAPIVVAANAVAFAAESQDPSGLGLSFVLPAVAEAAGSYDMYRSSTPGPTGQVSALLPGDFQRVNSQSATGVPGELVHFTDASALPGLTYRYLLVRRQESPGDPFVAYGPFAATATAEAPAVAFVSQSFPNPAHSGARTTIAYGVPGGAGTTVRTTLRFYDVRGRVVRNLVDQLVPPGRYQVAWDGTDDRGARLAPGMYFYEFVAGGTRQTRKTLLIGP